VHISLTLPVAIAGRPHGSHTANGNVLSTGREVVAHCCSGTGKGMAEGTNGGIQLKSCCSSLE
jgi:hypothetical protein